MNLQDIAQFFTIAVMVLTLTIVLQMSVTVTAYRLDELDALESLGREMENNYIYQPENELDDNSLDTPEYIPTDKRYARLSYYYGNRGRGGGSGGKYYNNRYYQNYYTPWKNLPDTECFRQQCSDDSDCCLRFSKCESSSHMCYNCWYGHPCRTSRDCCEKYPNCNKIAGGVCQS